MSGLSAFLKSNALAVENEKYVASKRFVEDGKPIEWELRTMTTEESESIQKVCTKKVPVPGMRGQTQLETDANKYAAMLVTACVVYPNLNDKELQDSYGVMGAESLIKKMLLPGEYTDLLLKVQEINGFDKTMDELVDDAKN